jgi:hypothetical protein
MKLDRTNCGISLKVREDVTKIQTHFMLFIQILEAKKKKKKKKREREGDKALDSAYCLCGLDFCEGLTRDKRKKKKREEEEERRRNWMMSKHELIVKPDVFDDMIQKGWQHDLFPFWRKLVPFLLKTGLCGWLFIFSSSL